MTVALVTLAALVLLAVVAVLARRRRTSAAPEPLDRAELQARQQALGQARRPEHGYGADRTYQGGGPF